MKIKDNPNFQSKPKPVTFHADQMVSEALSVMCEKNIGSIIVVNEDHTVAGIVTERDMMIRVLGAKIDPETTPLAKIMSSDLSIATEDDDLVDWMHTMSNERFRHLPIVDAQNKLLNVLSQGDFVAYTYPDLYEKIKQDLKGRLGKYFPILLIMFAAVTLGSTLLIA